MCLGPCPRVHTPPAIPPIATTAKTLCQRTLPYGGCLRSALSALRRLLRSGGMRRGRLVANALPAICAREHRATIPCGAVPLGPLGPHNTYPHGSAGPTRVGLRCLTTNALHPPAPSLCGMGSRRDRAVARSHLDPRGIECVTVCRAVRADGRAPRCGAQMVKSKGTLRL